MNKEICFAGFTNPEIESMQTTRADNCVPWKCVFAQNGATALAMLDHQPFSAIMVSLNMADMSAVDLLEQAAGLHPRMLRFALGGLSQRERVADAVGAPYQFVSPPWSLTELISIIERGLSLDAWLSNDQLRRFIPRLGRLPGLPASYFEVVKRAESPDCSIESVGEVISRDPALSARLLQTVNSAASGLAQKLTSPVEAVSMLGLDAVKSLVLCLQAFNLPGAAEQASVPLHQLWRHSFAVAQLARKVVMHPKGNARLANDAFTAGLLHRIGQIILATNLSKEYRAVLARCREHQHNLGDEELAEFGVTSDQLGAYLLGLWGMPLPLVEGVALAHQPSAGLARDFSILTAVHVADVLAWEDQALLTKIPVPKLDRDYLAALGLPTKSDSWRRQLSSSAAPEPEEKREVPSPTRRVVQEQARSPAFGVRPMAAMLGFFAVAGFGAGLVHWHSLPPRSSQASPGPTSALEYPVSEFDTVKVEAVFSHGGRALAVINGKTVASGENVNGITVISIQPSAVVLSSKGKQKTIPLR